MFRWEMGHDKNYTLMCVCISGFKLFINYTFKVDINFQKLLFILILFIAKRKFHQTNCTLNNLHFNANHRSTKGVSLVQSKNNGLVLMNLKQLYANSDFGINIWHGFVLCHQMCISKQAFQGNVQLAWNFSKSYKICTILFLSFPRSQIQAPDLQNETIQNVGQQR